jgi:2-polyprenyl-3-methyl-5-hydroxy-6-metoxy-1,4-benzoquinol methylase
MRISKCRVCGGQLKEKLLSYAKMPKTAQFLPDARSLKNDAGIKLEVYQCRCCGLVQLGADPVPYYRQVIRAAAVSPEMTAFRIKQFSKFFKRFSLQGKKVVEIGCGRGEYLALIKKCQAKAYGLEYCRQAQSYCVKSGLKVFKSFIASSRQRLPQAPFDAFMILNFLEHLPDPNSLLRGIANNLTEQGIGLVEVPNFDMILRKKLFTEFTSDHLFYFTSDTLRTLLAFNGFEALETKVIWHDYIISAVVRKRQPLLLADFSAGRQKLKNDLSAYLERFSPCQVAVWGAGHQALAILALMDLNQKIKYVVDSAKFKQGKFTPATHLPIVSPDTLKTDPVEAVIVMAASYSDEVARIIRRRYAPGIGISIVRDFGLEEIKS